MAKSKDKSKGGGKKSTGRRKQAGKKFNFGKKLGFNLKALGLKKKRRSGRAKKRSRTQTVISTSFKVSVVLNLLLTGALIWALATPTTYKDASAGYKISYPGDWIREDTNNGAFSAIFTKGDKQARLFAYGQRGAAAPFFRQNEETKNKALDDLVNLFNSGVNQFLLPDATLQNAEYKATREPRENGDEAIRIMFSGKDNDGNEKVGEHLILIVKSTGSVYNAVVLTDKDFWPEIQHTAEKIINSLVEAKS